MKLLRAITAGVWMVDESTLEAYRPLALQLLQGGAMPQWPQRQADRRTWALGPDAQVVAYYDDDDDDYVGPDDQADEMEQAPVVRVWPVEGLITKADQYCGPMGTETMMERMKAADALPNVRGHLLKIDSGGGEATNMETVARTIRGLKKPVVAWYNGVCASAAYYMACGAREIYASQATDQVGSIGVLISFADFRGAYETLGVKIHEVYAEQSTRKNEEFKAAMEGEYELLKTQLLNPYAAQFIATVGEMRPEVEAEAFTGRVYMTREATQAGLIDGLLTWEQAVARVWEMAQADEAAQMAPALNNVFGHSQVMPLASAAITHNNNSEMDLIQKLRAMLGVGTPSASDASLTPEEVQKLEAALAAAEKNATMERSLDEITATLTGLDNRLTAMQQQMDATREQLQQQVTNLAVSPGAGAAKAEAAQDAPLIEGKGVSPEAIKADLDRANAKIAQAVQNGLVIK